MTAVTSQPFCLLRLADGEIRYDASLASVADPASWFDAANPVLHAQQVEQGGRAAAWFIQLGQAGAVLRHYRRGGWARRLLRDQYLWLGPARARAFAEFSIMQALRASGLPVPQPLAAAIWRQGLLYRGALITARIAKALPLSACTDTDIWFASGRVIARMHHARVWHADLNVFNILVDEQAQVWLIDFDRARQGSLTPAQRSANLARLLRSVRKVVPLLESGCWPFLLRGYEQYSQEITQ